LESGDAEMLMRKWRRTTTKPKIKKIKKRKKKKNTCLECLLLPNELF
jgi:hypothetical protein